MRFRSGRWFTLPALLGILLTAAACVSWGWQQQPAPVPFKAQDEERERYQRPQDVLKALELSTGDWAADVGAGNGYYSQHMAEIVGPTGKVFAEDIADYAIDFLHQRVKMFDLRNVEIVKGDLDNPKLPPESLAAVLVVNAYHHFTEYEAMLNQILRSLKRGGRLVIADYSLPAHRGQPRADELKIHEIDPKIVQAEVEQAGFNVLECEDPFLKRMPLVNGDRIGAADMWLMVAARPK
jgi:predicted methyltransferase